MINNQSITGMSHTIISNLSSAPFDEIAIKTQSGDHHFLSYDMFKRLYNEAVESMNANMRIAEDYRQKYEAEHDYACRLEASLIELTETAD